MLIPAIVVLSPPFFSRMIFIIIIIIIITVCIVVFMRSQFRLPSLLFSYYRYNNTISNCYSYC